MFLHDRCHVGMLLLCGEQDFSCARLWCGFNFISRRRFRFILVTVAAETATATTDGGLKEIHRKTLIWVESPDLVQLTLQAFYKSPDILRGCFGVFFRIARKDLHTINTGISVIKKKNPSLKAEGLLWSRYFFRVNLTVSHIGILYQSGSMLLMADKFIKGGRSNAADTVVADTLLPKQQANGHP